MLERILQTCPTFQFTSCQTWPDTDHTLKSCKTYYTIRCQSWFGAANARTHFPDYTQLNTASSVKTGLILNTRIIIYIYTYGMPIHCSGSQTAGNLSVLQSCPTQHATRFQTLFTRWRPESGSCK